MDAPDNNHAWCCASCRGHATQVGVYGEAKAEFDQQAGLAFEGAVHIEALIGRRRIARYFNRRPWAKGEGEGSL